MTAPPSATTNSRPSPGIWSYTPTSSACRRRRRRRHVSHEARGRWQHTTDTPTPPTHPAHLQQGRLAVEATADNQRHPCRDHLSKPNKDISVWFPLPSRLKTPPLPCGPPQVTAQRRDARRRRKEVRQRQRLLLVFPLPFFAKAAPFHAVLPQRQCWLERRGAKRGGGGGGGVCLEEWRRGGFSRRSRGEARGPALLLCTRLYASGQWKGRSVFSRATEKGPDFC